LHYVYNPGLHQKGRAVGTILKKNIQCFVGTCIV
jgi:hypothetical protein